MTKFNAYSMFLLITCFYTLAVISGTTHAADTVAPRAPGNLTAQANSPTEVLLRWAASTDRGGRRRDWL